MAEFLLQSVLIPTLIQVKANLIALHQTNFHLLLKYGFDPNIEKTQRFSIAVGNWWYWPLKVLF